MATCSSSSATYYGDPSYYTNGGNMRLVQGTTDWYYYATDGSPKVSLKQVIDNDPIKDAIDRCVKECSG